MTFHYLKLTAGQRNKSLCLKLRKVNYTRIIREGEVKYDSVMVPLEKICPLFLEHVSVIRIELKNDLTQVLLKNVFLPLCYVYYSQLKKAFFSE